MVPSVDKTVIFPAYVPIFQFNIDELAAEFKYNNEIKSEFIFGMYPLGILNT